MYTISTFLVSTMPYVETLMKYGFELNQYDKCVANKVINGKQCTITWYVDDKKISHVDENVVTEMLKILKGHLGELTITRGKKYSFLGMTIEYNDNKTVSIDMKEQLQEAINMFPGHIPAEVVLPAAKHLFEVDEKAEQLDLAKSKVFHSIVMKLVYIMKRSRPDLEPSIAFLSTRVTKSDVDDWKKLARVLSYVRCTINDTRIIGATSLSELWSWIDGSHVIHSDMRGQMGGAMSMGKGTIHGRSTK